jgi:hypothetical protein
MLTFVPSVCITRRTAGNSAALRGCDAAEIDAGVACTAELT